MEHESHSFKATLIDGMMFLTPLVIIALVLGKVFTFTVRLAEPFIEYLPTGTIAGIAFFDVAALLGTLVLCLLAGMIARSRVGEWISESVESRISKFYPRYSSLKSMTKSITGVEGERVLKPVVVKFDDASQIGFEVERTDQGWITIYLPGSPDPWSGSVIHLTEDRVDPLDVDFTEINKTLRAFGKGTAESLSGPPDLL